MIARIRGTIIHKNDGYVIIETGGIGYKVRVPDHIILENSLEQETILYTELIVRQDILQLFGFSNITEVDLFRLLITVSHIGPQTGIAILNTLSLKEIYTAISTQNPQILSKVSGLGKKGAERIILELKNKITNIPEMISTEKENSFPMQDALLALKSLGYSTEEAERVLLVVKNEKDHESSSDIVREALIHLRKK